MLAARNWCQLFSWLEIMTDATVMRRLLTYYQNPIFDDNFRTTSTRARTKVVVSMSSEPDTIKNSILVYEQMLEPSKHMQDDQVLRDAAAARSIVECEEISFWSWNSSGLIWARKGGAH